MCNKKLTPSLQKDLTNFALLHNMSLEEVAQCIEIMNKKEKILKLHTSPISQNSKDKRWRTRLPNGRQIVKTKRSDLEDALIDFYSGLFENVKTQQPQKISIADQTIMGKPITLETFTLKTIYPKWRKIRESEVSTNTLSIDVRNWQQYIENDEIANIPLTSLNRNILKRWANNIINQNSMKRKYFNNIKTVLNSLLDFAVEEELIETNKLKGIKINKNLFALPRLKEELEEVFTEQEQKDIIHEAELESAREQSAIPLGICILFYTGMRIGELCGLKYGDIRNNYVYIQRMVIENKTSTDNGFKRNGCKITEHPKTSAGCRKIYLTTNARNYLKQIKELNIKNGFSTSDNDLIFQRKEGICNAQIFDGKLRKYCNPHHLNLPFAKSCHDIRRTYISKLFDSTDMNPDQIRYIAGHENIEMTMKYCRGRKEQKEVEQSLEKAFQPEKV